MRETFRDHGLPICCISGYTNIVHPDPAERRRRLDHLKAIIRHARHFGSPYVISETGTFNTESDWVAHPKNKTEEGFEDCRRVIKELTQVAYDHGAVFLLETYVNNVVGSVEETVRMFAEIDHPALGLLMDPTNYFEAHNIDAMDRVLKQIFDTLADRVRIAHAKDVKRSEDTTEKHADIDASEAAFVPRRRRDRAAGAGPRLAELRPLSAPAVGKAPEHPDHHRASRRIRCAARQEVPRRQAARERGVGPMVALYGRQFSRRDLAMHAGALSQFAGVRLMTLGDGVERGVRMLEFRTGSGLRFTVLADRAFDIADCEYRGAAIGWHSPAGFRHPGLHEYEGEGGLAWLRSFSGLLCTGGLDHILFMHSDDAAHYHYVHRKSVDSSIHGRISTIPGRLVAYGEEWRGDECVLFCEGVVQQSTVFGEDLHLIRRIEAPVGGTSFTLHDRVVNHGFYRTPHMMLYHINVGYPVLAEGSRYLAPILHTPWAAHAEQYRAQSVGYRTMPGPRVNFHEQVWEHWMGADADGRVPVALVNDALGLGFMVESSKRELPCQYRMAELPRRPLRARHRAGNQPRPRQAVREAA